MNDKMEKSVNQIKDQQKKAPFHFTFSDDVNGSIRLICTIFFSMHDLIILTELANREM